MGLELQEGFSGEAKLDYSLEFSMHQPQREQILEEECSLALEVTGKRNNAYRDD